MCLLCNMQKFDFQSGFGFGFGQVPVSNVYLLHKNPAVHSNKKQKKNIYLVTAIIAVGVTEVSTLVQNYIIALWNCTLGLTCKNGQRLFIKCKSFTFFFDRVKNSLVNVGKLKMDVKLKKVEFQISSSN